MPLKPKNSLFKSFGLSVSLLAMMQACSTGGPTYLDAEAVKGRPGLEAAKQRQEESTVRNPTMVSKIGELELTTRMSTATEVVEDQRKLGLLFSAGGGGSLALGLAAPAMFAASASAMVVGGIILIPMGSYIYLHEKWVWDSINKALNDFEFTRAVDRALKGRLIAAFTQEDMPEGKVEIIIDAFGMVESLSGDQGCMVASAHLSLSRRETESEEDRLQITTSNRSPDAPPPQCSNMESFAKNEARLVKDTLAEYAEVLAVMVIDRISRRSAK